ncbi:MAG: Exodeoxyribonuclease 7 large subunit [Candidatus Anoxychlamydiales bacterium]|nr:Exodeoxyribonuclease 7 large subunit [Candidatus Anoxychlamydiales bacterium]
MQDIQNKNILTVSQITFAIKNLLERSYRSILIKGEISNFKKQSSGHLYFSLKDNNAQISCAMFKNNSFSLKQLPKDGDEVIVQCEMSVYPPRGNYQLIVRSLSYVGIGELLQKLHFLKEKLKNKGYFDPINKKKIPMLPKTIGVITSPTGSVIRDILNVLKRRAQNFHLILNPVKVQGDGAKEEITKAIYDLNKYNLVDVIIIARGGGSLEDLWAFNEEIVADAIYESKIPVISAIGHETDMSISDFVADIRAPTPSAAAEIVVKEKSTLLDTLLNFKHQIYKSLINQKNTYKLNLDNIKKHLVFSSSNVILREKYQMLDEIKSNVFSKMDTILQRKKEALEIRKKQLNSIKPNNQIINLQENLSIIKKRLYLAINNTLDIHKERFIKLKNHLNDLNPKKLLKKGYSILYNKDSSIILSKQDVNINENITAIVSDGKIITKVEKKL